MEGTLKTPKSWTYNGYNVHEMLHGLMRRGSAVRDVGNNGSLSPHRQSVYYVVHYQAQKMDAAWLLNPVEWVDVLTILVPWLI